jgi:hypothetical protein
MNLLPPVSSRHFPLRSVFQMCVSSQDFLAFSIFLAVPLVEAA